VAGQQLVVMPCTQCACSGGIVWCSRPAHSTAGWLGGRVGVFLVREGGCGGVSTGGCACVAFMLSSNSRGRRMPVVQHGVERGSQFGVKSPVPDKAYLI
jgi:hypothetical protein